MNGGVFRKACYLAIKGVVKMLLWVSKGRHSKSSIIEQKNELEIVDT